jgi:hypothetical protein
MIRMLLVGYIFAIRSERQICTEIQVLRIAGSANWASRTVSPIILRSAVRGTNVSERAMPYVGYLRAWWRCALEPGWLEAKRSRSMRA